MRTQRLSIILVLLPLLWLATPAWGVSREIVQLQTQVQALQDQMTHMQQSFDERMGVMKNLVEQSTDERAMAPWEALGEETSDRLRTTIRPWSRAVCLRRNRSAATIRSGSMRCISRR